MSQMTEGFFFTAKRYTVAALVYPELRRVTGRGLTSLSEPHNVPAPMPAL